MPTGTFEYRDEGERVAIEQALAFVAQMRDLAVNAPHGQVLNRLEGHAFDAGRELLRSTLERGVQASVRRGGGKNGAYRACVCGGRRHPKRRVGRDVVTAVGAIRLDR